VADGANVTSIEAMIRFKAALQEFAEDAGRALSEAQSDVQRTVAWLQNDRMAHWQRELKKRTEKLNQAKAELFRKQLESNDTRTSAVVERKHVAKCQHLVDEAEEKIKAVKRWRGVLEREYMLFKAQCSQVAGIVAADVPITVARMEKMIAALQSYVALAAPSGRPPGLANLFDEPLPSESADASAGAKLAAAGGEGSSGAAA
jgi:hypothetical protein